MLQIASGLLHLHGKRILHRDLKTQNIFISKGGILKLGDLGISKVLEQTDQFATTITGTPVSTHCTCTLLAYHDTSWSSKL